MAGLTNAEKSSVYRAVNSYRKKAYDGEVTFANQPAKNATHSAVSDNDRKAVLDAVSGMRNVAERTAFNPFAHVPGSSQNVEEYRAEKEREAREQALNMLMLGNQARTIGGMPTLKAPQAPVSTAPVSAASTLAPERAAQAQRQQEDWVAQAAKFANQRIQNADTSRRMPTVERPDERQGFGQTFMANLLEGSGLASMVEAAENTILKNDKDIPQNYISGIVNRTAQRGQQEAPVAATAGNIAGGVGSLLAAGAVTGGAASALGVPANIGTRALRSALTFGITKAAGEAGAVTGGRISTEKYGKDIARSGVSGAAGSIASGLVSSGIAKTLVNKNLMTPFMEYVRNLSSSTAFSAASTGTGYLLTDEEERPAGDQIAKQLATAFLYNAVMSGIETMQTTEQAKAYARRQAEQLQNELNALTNVQEGSLSAEGYADRANAIMQRINEFRNMLNSTYYAGGQADVDAFNRALDAMEDMVSQNIGRYGSAPSSAAPSVPLLEAAGTGFESPVVNTPSPNMPAPTDTTGAQDDVFTLTIDLENAINDGFDLAGLEDDFSAQDEYPFIDVQEEYPAIEELNDEVGSPFAIYDSIQTPGAYLDPEMDARMAEIERNEGFEVPTTEEVVPTTGLVDETTAPTTEETLMRLAEESVAREDNQRSAERQSIIDAAKNNPEGLRAVVDNATILSDAEKSDAIYEGLRQKNDEEIAALLREVENGGREERNDVYGAGSERLLGDRTGEQISGSVSSQRTLGESWPAGAADFRDNEAKALRIEKAQGAEQVINTAAPGQTVYSVAGDTEATSKAKAVARAQGVKNHVLYASKDGGIVVRKSGKLTLTRGSYESASDTITACINNPKATAEQITDHESVHRGIAHGLIDMQSITDTIKSTNAELWARIDAVVSAYSDWSNGSLDNDAAMEELFCDAGGKINQFAEYDDDLSQELADAMDTVTAEIRPMLNDALGGALDAADFNEGFGTEGLNETVASLEENGVTITDGAAVQYSYDTWSKTDKEELLEDLTFAGFEEDEAQKWIDDVSSVAAIIERNPKLDYTAGRGSWLKNNAETIKSLDGSFLCPKKSLFQGTYNAIVEKNPNITLDAEQYIALKNLLKSKGYEVPCVYCYNESRVQQIGTYAKEFVEQHKDWKITSRDLTTTEGLSKLEKDRPDVYKAWLLYRQQAHGAQRSVKFEANNIAYTRDDIMTMSAEDRRAIMAEGGLRWFAFSDFKTEQMIDAMQAVLDLSAMNMRSYGYTKQMDFVRVFGNTGIMINMSVAGDVKNGKLIFDSTDGMDIDTALALKDSHSKTAGLTLVGISDEHILAAMADPRIDMIIPFHRSGLSNQDMKDLGISHYTDYQQRGYQREHWLSDGKVVGKDLLIGDFWDNTKTGKENAERYLAECRRTGRIPKFPQFLDRREDSRGRVTYALKKDGSTDGYWKLLVDFKMYDNDGNNIIQQEVRPNFDMDAAREILENYEGDADKLPVAKDVVREFLKEQGPQAEYNAFGLKSYSDEEIEGWENSKFNISYADSEQDIESFVRNVIKTGSDQRLYCGRVSDDTARRILKDTGVDVQDYNVAITSSFENTHADPAKEQKRGQIAITPDIVAKFPLVISDYDTVTLSKTKDGAPALEFRKNIDGDKVVISNVVRRRKMLTIQTMYGWALKKNSPHATNAANATSAITPGATVSANSSINKIAQNSQKSNEFVSPLTGENVQYSTRLEPPPKKTGTAYKVFMIKDGKLYPPMVANPGGADTPVGIWLNADVGQSAPASKTGRPQVQAGGKGTATGKSSLAFRPGWHLGEVPVAKQFARADENGQKTLFPENFVWAECEYAMDHDYQDEAMSYGYTENGKFHHSYAGLPAVPVDGYYKYRTNPNPDTVPWVITGAMKVNRILDDDEVAEICRQNGVEPMQRKGGPIDLSAYGVGNQVREKVSSWRSIPGQLSLGDLESAMAQNPKLNQTKAQNKLAAEAVQDLTKLTNEDTGKPVDRGVALTITKELLENGKTELVGKRVKNADDLAAIAQVYRDPRFETLRYFFADKDGNLVFQTAVSSGVPNASLTIPSGENYIEYLDRLSSAAKKQGATTVYMLHNHPSGSVSPSQEDINATGQLYHAFKQRGLNLTGSIVIDHTEYALLSDITDTSLTPYVKKLPRSAMNDLSDVFTPAKRNALLGTKISSAEDLEYIAKAEKAAETSDDLVSLIFSDNRGLVRVIQKCGVEFANNKEALVEHIRSIATGYGCPQVFAVTRNEEVFEGTLRDLCSNMGVFTDVLYMWGGGGSATREVAPLFRDMLSEFGPHGGNYDEFMGKKIEGFREGSMKFSSELRPDPKMLDRAVRQLHHIRNIKSIEEVEKRNDRLAALNTAFNDAITAMPDNPVSKHQTYQIANKYLAGGSEELKKDVRHDLRELYTLMGQTTKVNARQLTEAAVSIAEKIVDGADRYERDSDMKDMSDRLKKTKLYISPELKKEIEYNYGSYADFRRLYSKFMGMTLDKDKATDTVDSFYAGVSGQAGGMAGVHREWFPADIINEADQLVQIADVAKLVGTGEKLTNDYGDDYNEIVYTMAQELMADYFRANGNEKYMQKVQAVKQEMREEYQDKLDYIAAKYRDQLEKSKGEVAKKQAQFLAYKEEQRNKRFDKAMRDKLWSRIRTLKKMKGDEHFNREKAEIFSQISAVRRGALSQATIDRLNSLANSDEVNNPLNPLYTVKHHLAALREIEELDRKHVGDMTAEEVAAYLNAVTELIHYQRTENRLLDESKGKYVSKKGRTLIRQQDEVSTRKFHRLLEAYRVNSLAPTRALPLFDGYVPDGVMAEYAQKFFDGDMKAQKYMMDAEKSFAEWLEDEKYMRDLTKYDVTLTNSDGEEAKVSRDMAIAMYLAGRDADNVIHTEAGGWLIPSEKEYRNGKRSEAYYDPTEFVMQQRDYAQLDDILTEKDKRFADKIYEYFNKTSKEAMNEVSRKLYGYDIAMVDNYFPITVDKGLIMKDIDVYNDPTLESSGFTKERTKSKLPIYLDGVSNVLKRSINNVGRYYGMAVPLRDFNSVYNFTAYDDPFSAGRRLVSGKKAFEHAWRTPGKDYLENLMSDLNRGSREKQADWIDRIYAGYGSAVLGANVRVMLSQASSYPMALTILHPDSLAKGLAASNRSVDMDYIDSITPSMYMRRKGMTGTELGETYSARQRLREKPVAGQIMKSLDVLTGGIQRVDVWTTTHLVSACIEEMKTYYPELKPGTKAYDNKLSDLIEQVNSRTQPSYGTMNRNEYAKRSGTGWRLLTMFKTQTFNMYGELYDAVGRDIAYRQLYKEGKVTKSQADKARGSAVAALVAVLLSQLLFEAIKKAVNLSVYHDPGEARDENGDVKLVNVAESVAKDTAKDLIGMAPGMDLAINQTAIPIAKKFFGGKDPVYDLDAPGLGTVNDIRTALANLATAASKYREDPSKENLDALRKREIQLAMKASYLGYPLQNTYNTLNGIYLNAKYKPFNYDEGKGLFGLKDNSPTKAQYANMAIRSFASGNEKRGKFAVERTSTEKIEDALGAKATKRDGKTVRGSKAADAMQKVNELDMSDDMKVALIQSMYPKQSGLTVDNLDAYIGTESAKANGNQEGVVNYLKGSSLTEEEKRALWEFAAGFKDSEYDKKMK